MPSFVRDFFSYLMAPISGADGARQWPAARMDVNRANPVVMALATDMQRSMLANLAVSSCGMYTGRLNTFVALCEALVKPKASLPALDDTVALYLDSVMNGAKTFAPVMAASAAIAFYQKINLF